MIFFEIDGHEFIAEITDNRPDGACVSFTAPDGSTLYLSRPVQTTE